MKKITLLFTIIFLCFSISSCSKINTPEKSAKNFITAFYKGDIKEALKYTDMYDNELADKDGTKDFLTSKLKAESQKVQDLANANGGVKKFIANPASYFDNNQGASVTVQVIFKKSDAIHEEHLKLHHIKKGWVVFF